MKVPDKDLAWCLEVERSVPKQGMPLYLEWLDNITLAERIKNPRSEHDIRDGCILIGAYMRSQQAE